MALRNIQSVVSENMKSVRSNLFNLFIKVLTINHFHQTIMAKFKIGDRCKVIKNFFAPKCIGEIIEITEIVSEKDGKVLYKAAIEVKGKVFDCYASEGCLELIKEEE